MSIEWWCGPATWKASSETSNGLCWTSAEKKQAPDDFLLIWITRCISVARFCINMNIHLICIIIWIRETQKKMSRTQSGSAAQYIWMLHIDFLNISSMTAIKDTVTDERLQQIRTWTSCQPQNDHHIEFCTKIRFKSGRVMIVRHRCIMNHDAVQN